MWLVESNFVCGGEYVKSKEILFEGESVEDAIYSLQTLIEDNYINPIIMKLTLTKVEKTKYLLIDSENQMYCTVEGWSSNKEEAWKFHSVFEMKNILKTMKKYEIHEIVI